MYVGLFSLLLIQVCAALAGNEADSNPTIEDYENLADYIEKNAGTYLHSVLPRPTAKSDPVNVTLRLSLLNLNVDKQNDKLYVGAYLQQRWTDYRLKWNPKDFGGITDTKTPYWNLWEPDLTLFNGYRPQKMTPPPAESLVIVNSDGGILYFRRIGLDVMCRFDRQEGADQTCELNFGSWTYDGSQIDFYPNGNDITVYNPDPHMNITGTKAERLVTMYACCPEPYVSVKFTFNFKK